MSAFMSSSSHFNVCGQLGLAAIIVIFVVTTIEHYLNGGIRIQGQPG